MYIYLPNPAHWKFGSTRVRVRVRIRIGSARVRVRVRIRIGPNLTQPNQTKP